MSRRFSKPGIIPALLSVALVTGCNSAGQGFASNGGASALPGDGDSAVLDASTIVESCIVAADSADLARQVLSLVNIERARVGVDPLTLNDQLIEAAEDYSCTMAANDFFAHVNPDTGEGPGDRAALAGYTFFAVGENLAAGQSTSAEAIEGWMESPGHRQNLLSPEWRDTGIGVRRGGSYHVYWVQLFGKPATLEAPAATGGDALTVARQ